MLQKSTTITNGRYFQTQTWTVVSKLVYVAWSCTVLSLTQLQALSSIKTSQRSFSSSITTFWCTASSRSVCNQVENISIKTQDYQNRNVTYTVWKKVIFQWAHHNQRSPLQKKLKSSLLCFFPCQKQSVLPSYFWLMGSSISVMDSSTLLTKQELNTPES